MIELSVIGGYLGSGKTTLLNEILDRTDGERIAVIVNDFGTINIDAQLIGTNQGRTWEIANGCICCDLSDGMAAAIESIRTATPTVTRAFVEVSGVGQPDVVARWGDHPGFSRGGAIVCADVTSIQRATTRKWVGETVASQLRGADRLLLTKTDLAQPEQIAEVTDWLANLPGVDAEIVERSSLIAGESTDRPPAAATTDSSSADSPAVSSGSAVPGRPGSDEAYETHSSWSIRTRSAVDPEQLRALVLDLPEDFVRIKGIFEDSRRHGRIIVVNFDGSRFDVQDIDAAQHGAGSDAFGRLVVIAAGSHTGTPKCVAALARMIRGTVDD